MASTKFLVMNLFTINLFFLLFGQSLARRSSLIGQSPDIIISDGSSSSIRATVYPNGADHLMEFSIGTPPIKVRGVIDTGSDLVWSRCAPCAECVGRSNAPVFHPQSSSTYREVTCDSAPCTKLNPTACDNGTTTICPYMYGYGDNSFTTGIVATETLTFDTIDGGTVSFPDLAFGCGHNNSASFDDHGVGIFGMGGSSTSLISQLSPTIGGKFSYCLMPFHENTSTSVMYFGDNSVISGPNVVSTPLIPREDPTFYFVTLQSISVAGGSKMIEVAAPDAPDATATGTGNMFIDSGTTVTLLDTNVFNQLSAELTNVVRLPPTTDAGKTFLCYNTTSPRDWFPEITFHFEGGADLTLHPFNTFTVPSPDGLVCLAMQATNGTAIFGNQVQQNFLIAYDLVARRVSFAPTECANFS